MELASPDGAKGMDEDMDGCQHNIIVSFPLNYKRETKKNSFKTLSWDTFVAAVAFCPA